MAKAIITKDRQALQVSGSTVYRYREPTNPEMARHMTQFIVDYSQQSGYIPDRLKRTLVESTQGHDHKVTTTNKSGRSAVFGAPSKVQLGSSSDESGNY